MQQNNTEDLTSKIRLLIMFLVNEMDIQEIEKFVWKLQLQCIFYGHYPIKCVSNN